MVPRAPSVAHTVLGADNSGDGTLVHPWRRSSRTAVGPSTAALLESAPRTRRNSEQPRKRRGRPEVLPYLPADHRPAAGLLGTEGLRRAAVSHRGRGRHLQPRDLPALPRRAPVARGLRRAVHAPHRRALRREPVPPGSLLPVPGRHQAVAGRHPGRVPAVARGSGHRPDRARRALCRGQLGGPHAGRLGTGLGGLDRRHGRQPVPRGGRRMSTLLIEIGCEELPYKVCESVVRQLEDTAEAPGLVHKLLEAERLLESGAPDLRVLVSPRRIAVLVEGVPERQTAKTDDYRGPKAEIAYAAAGGLTKAARGVVGDLGLGAAVVVGLGGLALGHALDQHGDAPRGDQHPEVGSAALEKALGLEELVHEPRRLGGVLELADHRLADLVGQLFAADLDEEGAHAPT